MMIIYELITLQTLRLQILPNDFSVLSLEITEWKFKLSSS